METKRLILAIALSMVVIIAYQYFFMPKEPPKPPQTVQPKTAQGDTTDQAPAPGQDPQQAAESTTQKPKSGLSNIFSKKEKKVAATDDTPVMEAVSQDISAETVSDIVVETDLFTATFSNKGAGLKSFVLKKYNDDIKQPMELISNKVHQDIGGSELYPFHFSPFEDEEGGFLMDINTRNFVYDGTPTITMGAGESKEIVFKYASVEKNLSVEKRFIIKNGSYVLGIDYRFIKDGRIVTAPIVFGPDLENNINQNRVMQQDLRVGAFDGEDVRDKTFKSVDTEPIDQGVERGGGSLGSQFAWAVYDTTYFAAMFKTRGKINYHVLKERVIPESAENDKDATPVEKLYSYIIVTNPQYVFLGPKDERILAEMGATYGFRDAGQAVAYGWSFFGAIARVMLKAIVWIQGFVPNVGWALVLFTIFIKILLFPLTYTSSVSMAKMQALQPKIKAIKKKYKNLKDPEQRKQMNMDTMALYKSEKVNPAGGCLPMLLQMPILFAFFRLLPISINFRHEPWILWITDLSVKDAFYVLPILMGLTQLIVTKMSPTSGDSTQKKFMYIMPVVMVVLFMSYSAGLNLYWFISNLLQIGQQHIINEKIFKEKKEEDKQRKASKRKKGGKN